jgi:DNA-binding CsgD family transcriptional regulator
MDGPIVVARHGAWTGCDALSSTILRVGMAAFGEALLNSICSLAEVEHLTVISFPFGAAPEPIVVSSRQSTRLIERLSRDYTGAYYRQDPNFSLIDSWRSPSEILLLRHDLRAYQESYRRHFFEDSRVIEKITLLANTKNFALAVNAYSTGRNGGFRPTEMKKIAAAAPIVMSAAIRHAELCVSHTVSIEDIVALIAASRNVALTRRESQVCANIISGRTSEATSLVLNIAISSVLTFRKSLYKKLRIGSQAELFGLALRCSVPEALRLN